MIDSLKKARRKFNGDLYEYDYTIQRQAYLKSIHAVVRAFESMKSSSFCIARNVNAKHCVTALILLTLGTIIYYTHYVETSPLVRLMHHDTRPSPIVRCRFAHEDNGSVDASKETNHRSSVSLRIDPKVLVFVETTYSRLGKDVAELLVHNRIKWVTQVQVSSTWISNRNRTLFSDTKSKLLARVCPF